MATFPTTTTLPKLHPGLSRRALMREMAAAGMLAAVPVAAVASSPAVAATDEDASKSVEALQQHLAVLGKALHDDRLNVKWSKSKTGKTSSAKFTIWLDGNEGAQLMGSILAGMVFADICTADDLIGRLERKS